ncbi:MAG: fructosamine kinase family protein [Gammaproteobacteria bacterium]|nr:fructosamine kinase family protein [Gammaproteobacteria bacterium]
MTYFKQIMTDIEHATGKTLANYTTNPIGGGCINSAYKLESADNSYFVKLNHANLIDMFTAEAEALSEFTQINCVRVPQVICSGIADSYSYLALEYIDFKGLSSNAGKLLGSQLAQLHQQQQSYFGWHRDNTIGSTEQINSREHDWVTFWQQHRLGKQLQIAAKNGYRGKIQDRGHLLLENVARFFDGYSPAPVLLHGDLWGGNAAADELGNPVIFDPASYYGDRETDIAMTELFGGFGADFYDSYQAHYPLDPGYRTRKTLYNLYHIINHVNLFGSGYLGQAQSMIEHLLAEI